MTHPTPKSYSAELETLENQLNTAVSLLGESTDLEYVQSELDSAVSLLTAPKSAR